MVSDGFEIKRILKKLYLPKSDSHKGQNGRLLIIGGSRLFHSASLWALEVSSRIVDLVHYASVEENNKIVHELKKNFRNGIVIERSDIEAYIEEDDCILIGPGMLRVDHEKIRNPESGIRNLKEILEIRKEGLQTYYLTKYLLRKYPRKKWVIDAGALQMTDLEDIPHGAILTPHRKEFEGMLSKIPITKIQNPNKIQISKSKLEQQAKIFSVLYKCTVLLKGEEDVVASGDKTEIIKGGNAGMTKGGTGDVLAGLVAAFYCKNDAFISAVSAAYINKKAGDELFKMQGYWYNSSDLSNQIPQMMRNLII